MVVGHAGPAVWSKPINAHANYYCRDTDKRSWRNVAQVGLIFEQDHGAPEPVPDGFATVWPIIARRPHVVFAGDAGPGVDRVEIELPHDTLTCHVREARGRRVWMSFPEPLEMIDGAVATATWLTGGCVVATRQTVPLRSPWTGYAPA